MKLEENLISKLNELVLIFDKIKDDITNAENIQNNINEIMENNEDYEQSEEVTEIINQLEDKAENICLSFKRIYG